jgi:hypothetical protein
VKVDVDACLATGRQSPRTAIFQENKMKRIRMLTSLALCLSITPIARAQEAKLIPTIIPPQAVAPPGNPNRVFPAPQVVQFPPGVFQRIAPTAVIPPAPSGIEPTRSGEHYSVPAKIEMNDGATLTGEIQSSGPLHCVALFGEAAIPFNQIKGIEWRTETDQPEGQQRQATLILLNGDSLTVTVATPVIQVKTTWGHAAVELPNVRSIVMTIEKVKWSDTPNGRRALVPE